MSENYHKKCRTTCDNWETCPRRSIGLKMDADMKVENCRYFERKKKKDDK